MADSKAPFDFEERRNDVFYHNLRVFISGTDVTPYLTNNISYSYSDRDGTNIAKFTLHNANQAFSLTQENLDGQFRLVTKDTKVQSPAYKPEGRYSEQAKFEIYALKKQINQRYRHAVRTFGPIEGTGTGGRLLSSSNSILTADQTSSTVTSRYPLNLGSLVFHKFDQIRIFELDPKDRNGDRWVCRFTGFLDTKPFSQDYTTGASTIEISAQDIRMLMQYMRTQTNPAAEVSNENTLAFRAKSTDIIKDTPNAGYFNDLMSPRSSFSHILGGLSWIDSIRTLVFGTDRRTIIDSARSATGNGIGKYVDTTPIRYTPAAADRSSVLEDWNLQILFGDTRTYMSEREMILMGQGTYDEGNYSAYNGKVRYLLPIEGGPPSNTIEYGAIETIIQKYEWASRLELINGLCKSVDYQFYISGIGDMIFEFPMYDFFPDHYGVKYNNLYTVSQNIIRDTINDEGGTPISALRISSQKANRNTQVNHQGPGNTNDLEHADQFTETIFSNVLASRIGVHMETHSVPAVANQNRLIKLGMIEFSKRIAQFDQFDLDMTYRPYLGPNRPIYHQIKERIGITKSVSYNYELRGEVTTKVALDYTRKKEGETFRFITGGEASPISYSKIYDTVSTPGQGLNATGSGITKDVKAGT